jgi:hypothetical protein
MKRCLQIQILVLLFAATLSWAQQQPASGDKSSSAQPAGKRPPQAKTPAEFADYNAAYATKGGAAMEKAADDFSAKYPASELKAYLYSKATHEYQEESNSAKMLVMGEKVVALDPDNSVALVLTATVISDTLSNTDPDPDKVAIVKRRVAHAFEIVDGALPNTQRVPPEQLTAYKNTLRSMGHSALGITSLKLGDSADAEKELKLAAELNQSKPDPYIWYHLALAQDREGTATVNNDEQQKKYSEALASVREAVRYAGSNPDLDKRAQNELKRLQQLTGQESGTPPGPSQQK